LYEPHQLQQQQLIQQAPKTNAMKHYLMLPLLLVICKIAIAQSPPPPPPPPPMDDDKIEALRVAFLTKYLDLSTEEAQKFWPVYNAMQKEIDAVRTSESDLRKGKDVDAMTDEELNKMINQHFDNEQKLLDIKKKYLEEFKKILSLKKVALLADAENEFKREVMKHARDKKGQGPPPPDDKPSGKSGGQPPAPDPSHE